jgi:5-oxoprolinase (ATP-hydrolysing) subunit A
MNSDRVVDICADVGEGFGQYTIGSDEDLIAALSSANIACGFHAGDPVTMEKTVRSCVERHVGIGAHPGFADRAGFGRRTIAMTQDEVRTDVLYQLGALRGFAAAAGTDIGHVCPHGRLGNLCATDEVYARGTLEAIVACDPTLLVVTFEGVLQRLAEHAALEVVLLGCPDRVYGDDGAIVSRTEASRSVLDDVDAIVAQAVSLAVNGTVKSVHGREVAVRVDSLLLHGDNHASVRAAPLIRRALADEGVVVGAMRATRPARPDAQT